MLKYFPNFLLLYGFRVFSSNILSYKSKKEHLELRRVGARRKRRGIGLKGTVREAGRETDKML